MIYVRLPQVIRTSKWSTQKVLCQDVLEQLLEEKVGELEDVQPQREFRYTSGGKPIRLAGDTQSILFRTCVKKTESCT